MLHSPVFVLDEELSPQSPKEATSHRIFNLRSRSKVLGRSTLSELGCNQFSKLPFDMTFTATTLLFDSSLPLYTEPKLPDPIKLVVENPSVAKCRSCEEGSAPENLLIAIDKKLKFFKCPISSDMLPSKLVYPMDKVSREERFHMEDGIYPVKLFVKRYNFSSFLREPSSFGIMPISLFVDKSKYLSSVQLVKLMGISLINALSHRERFCNLYKRPNSAGISPWKLLLLRLRFLKKESLSFGDSTEQASPIPNSEIIAFSSLGCIEINSSKLISSATAVAGCLLPVSISKTRIPKEYTSPCVDTSEPVPYSDMCCYMINALFRTFIATSLSSDSILPLYTEPKLPDPIKFTMENPSVTLCRFRYDTMASWSIVGEVEEDVLFLFLLHSEMPPQSLLLPAIDIALAFLKTPSVGTSPSNILKETFKYSRTEMFCKPVGIEPDKLFCDRSR
ncbi:hypothetical protein G2W53_016971 [Senna tora]|uniref:Uncharacterized protein n=1 Tax=Senna tora TaxID=362788 RepID=A0A834TR46_9FABA|nr:hypothetical protein G2W53_016971 [Senna tora]